MDACQTYFNILRQIIKNLTWWLKVFNQIGHCKEMLPKEFNMIQFKNKNVSPTISPNESITVQMFILCGWFNCGELFTSMIHSRSKY